MPTILPELPFVSWSFPGTHRPSVPHDSVRPLPARHTLRLARNLAGLSASLVLLALPLICVCTLPQPALAAKANTAAQAAKNAQPAHAEEGDDELLMEEPAADHAQETTADTAAAPGTAAAAEGEHAAPKEGSSQAGDAAEQQAAESGKAAEADSSAASKAGAAEDKSPDADSPYAAQVIALWPSVDSFVTSPFGERRGSTVPLLSDVPMRPRYHSGLDLRGHLGWPVRSLKDGTVLQAGQAGSAGLMVKVAQTDGKTVSYAHLGKVLVKKGDTVKRGQHVGEVGCTGRTTGAHVHLTVRNREGRHIDPRKELTGLWELYDPPLEDLKKPVQPQACMRRGVNKRLAGTQQYLRMRKALIESGSYKIPDIEPWEKSH